MKKNEQSLRDLENTTRLANMQMMEVKKREGDKRNICRNASEIFPSFMENNNNNCMSKKLS